MFKRQTKRRAAGTVGVYTSGYKRICTTIRMLEGLGEKAPIPVTLLKPELFTRLHAAWTDVGEGRLYDLSLYLLSAWAWAASQPARYPGIPMAPARELVLPEPPPRIAAREPTLAELDAICRRAARSNARDLHLIVAAMRLTGLRIGQVLGMRAGHFELGARMLTIAIGKSKREKVEQRKVPMHRELVSLLRDRIEGQPPDALIFPRSRGAEGLRAKPDGIVRRLWEAATAAGETRAEVWNPAGRKARPDHAFRAGFLRAMRDADIEADVRHRFVGHAPKSTEDKSYSPPTDAQLRDAIDKIPGIDWTGPATATEPRR